MKLREAMTMHGYAPIISPHTASFANVDVANAPYHPPSLKNPQRVPADNPKEKSNRFLDKFKRNSKGTKKFRMKLLKKKMPPNNSVVSTLVAPHSSIGSTYMR